MIYRYLRYTLTLNEPAILTMIGGDPNSSWTLPYIPGSAIRGSVARVLGDPGNDLSKMAEFKKMVLGDGVRYLNAYPRADSRRALPVPVSFRAKKDDLAYGTAEVNVVDLSAFDVEEWPDDQLVNLTEPFVTLGAAQPKRVNPKRGARIHHQRDRTKGRAWADPETGQEHGTIFAFEYIEAGQEFDGIIQVFGNAEDVCQRRIKHIKEILTGPLLIGRSRRSGYGGNATIEWRDDKDREVLGRNVVSNDITKGTEFRVLLISDYIGRNPRTGQLDPSYLVNEIERQLDGHAKVIRRRWKFGITGGFNRKWRLEVQQAPICVAGSVLVLRATRDISLEDIKLIEHEGLGERRVEGFGRVVFLKAATSSPIVIRCPAEDPHSQPTRDTRNPPEIVKFVEKRILLKAITRTIQGEAARLVKSVASPPSTNLIGRLRNVLRGEPGQALSILREWLGMEGRKEKRLKQPAMEQLDRCCIGDVSRKLKLSDWLRGLVRNDGEKENLADTLHGDVLAQRYHMISEETARQCFKELENELRVKLIDATLAALARRKRGGTS